MSPASLADLSSQSIIRRKLINSSQKLIIKTYYKSIIRRKVINSSPLHSQTYPEEEASSKKVSEEHLSVVITNIKLEH